MSGKVQLTCGAAPAGEVDEVYSENNIFYSDSMAGLRVISKEPDTFRGH